MSGGGVMGAGLRRFLNLGLLDGRKRAYTLQRLDLSKMDLFHGTAEEAAAHGKLVPALTPAKARARHNRRRVCKSDLAAAEAAAPRIRPLKSELVMKPPVVSSSVPSCHCIHFLPTASESKVVLGDRANRMFRFDAGHQWIETLPNLHAHKDTPLAVSVPPSDWHLLDGEDGGDLYIIDGLLHPHSAEVHPQFEALVWKGHRRSVAASRSWHCDVLPLPPWISHQKCAYVCGHALVAGDTICFSISGAEGHGTYCFHTVTREWSKAGDWIMPFDGKAEYVPDLGLWFGLSHHVNLPYAVDLSGVVRGEELPPEKLRFWADDDMPEEWQPSRPFQSKVISLGSGRFIVAEFMDGMVFDKDSGEMEIDNRFVLFTGVEVGYNNGNGSGNNGAGKDDGNYNSGSNGNDVDNASNGSKGEGMSGLRMIKHKSGRYMFNAEKMIEVVL